MSSRFRGSFRRPFCEPVPGSHSDAWDIIEWFEAIERSEFDLNRKFIAYMTISSLKLLKEIAREKDVTLDDLTYEMVIEEIGKTRH